MGLSPAEFWDMSPYLFGLKADGYFQRENRAGHYFRETLALQYNINRAKNAPVLEGKDILTLPGETLPKAGKSKRSQSGGWTFKEMAEAARKASEQAQREMAENARQTANRESLDRLIEERNYNQQD